MMSSRAVSTTFVSPPLQRCTSVRLVEVRVKTPSATCSLHSVPWVIPRGVMAAIGVKNGQRPAFPPHYGGPTGAATGPSVTGLTVSELLTVVTLSHRYKPNPTIRQDFFSCSRDGSPGCIAPERRSCRYVHTGLRVPSGRINQLPMKSSFLGRPCMGPFGPSQ